MSIVYIYTLEHPETQEVRYVGKTDNPKRRLEEHYSDKRAAYRGNWVKSLRKQGLRPVMKILEEATLETWENCEVYWIGQMRAWGFRLCNLENGGLGSAKYTPVLKKRISDALKAAAAYNLGSSKACAKYTLCGKLVSLYKNKLLAAASVGVTSAAICYATKNEGGCAGFLWRNAVAESVPERIVTNRKPNGKRQRSKEEIAQMIAKRMATRKRLGSKNKQFSAEELARRKTLGPARGMAVIQIFPDGTQAKWPSKKQAARETGVHMSSITKSITGKYAHAGGCQWEYTKPPEN